MNPERASGSDVVNEIMAEVLGSGGECLAGAFLRAQSDEVKEQIRLAIAQGATASAIGRWMRNRRGFNGSVDSATRHLKGRCGCKTTF